MREDIDPGITETLYIWNFLISPTEYSHYVDQDNSKNQSNSQRNTKQSKKYQITYIMDKNVVWY